MNAVERAHIDKKARLVSGKKTPDEKIFTVLSEVFSAQCVLWMHATVFTRKRERDRTICTSGTATAFFQATAPVK